MNIADRILYLRKSKGISQEELADKVGVSRQAVSKWESEQSMPDVEKIIIMSDYFNVTTDYILKGIEVVENKEEKSKEIVGKVLYIASTALIVYIPFQVNHLHGQTEPVPRRMRATLTETEPMLFYTNYQATAC